MLSLKEKVIYFYHMLTPNYETIALELKHLIKGDVSLENIDRERTARDTSLFYIKPEMVVYPKNSLDIGALFEYVLKKKIEGYHIAVAMRSAGTCMTGGSLTFSIVVD